VGTKCVVCRLSHPSALARAFSEIRLDRHTTPPVSRLGGFRRHERYQREGEVGSPYLVLERRTCRLAPEASGIALVEDEESDEGHHPDQADR
jgi:hypothetical protein